MCNYLYLIHSGDVFKIGVTNDIDRRMKKYKTHNPLYQMITFREITSLSYAEDTLKKILRSIYSQVMGTREWFHAHAETGLLSKDQFDMLIDSIEMMIDPQPSQDMEEFVLLGVQALFAEKGIPFEYLFATFMEDGSPEWMEYVTLSMEYDECLKISINDLESKLLLYYFCGENLPLLDLVYACEKEQEFDEHGWNFHDKRARSLLNAPIRIERESSF